MLAAARAQVAAYPTATFIAGEAIVAVKEPDTFSVRLATGGTLESIRLVLAFGISDELPAIPGLTERWSFRAPCPTAMATSSVDSESDQSPRIAWHGCESSIEKFGLRRKSLRARRPQSCTALAGVPCTRV
jgi:hypothetical protein